MQIYPVEHYRMHDINVFVVGHFVYLDLFQMMYLFYYLPQQGFLLDVVWLMPTSTDFPIRERADAVFFSVMRRLEVWHKARVTIVLGAGLEGEDHPSLAYWKTFIESRVVALKRADGTETKPQDILSSSSLAWQGQVKYISSRVGFWFWAPFHSKFLW